MRTTAAVLALTAAGVVLTGGLAAADTPTDGGAWTVIGDQANPWTAPADPARPWTATNLAEQSDGGASSAASTPPRIRRVPSRRRPVARTGTRVASACQDVRAGAWLVRPGDTLWRIATCTRHDLADLVELNDLSDGGRLIFPGDRIAVR